MNAATFPPHLPVQIPTTWHKFIKFLMLLYIVGLPFFYVSEQKTAVLMKISSPVLYRPYIRRKNYPNPPLLQEVLTSV
jgi:hypothetical protein